MADQNIITELPDYDNPPLVEAILGVQFDHLVGFTNAHLGAFWKILDENEWTVVADAPSLPPQFERFNGSAKWAKGIELQLTQKPATRLQIKNKDRNRMIQLQNGRLHFNWIGESGESYPRYEKVRQGFIWALEEFVKFAHQANVGEFRPNQWEVTYLNHIPKNTVWRSPADWRFFEPLAVPTTVENVIESESFGGTWHFVIPERRGRLHIEWQHGRKIEANEEELEVIVLTLTARGSVEQTKDCIETVIRGLDLGRQTIVQSFAALMSKDANRYWGLKDATGND